MKSIIQQSSIVSPNSKVLTVLATMVGLGVNSTSDEVYVSLANAAGGKMRPIPGSVVGLRNCGAGTHIVRAHLVPSIDTLPVGCKDNMQSLSSNVFMDDNDRVWQLRTVGEDSVLVGSISEDPEELLDMMNSCSSDVAAAQSAPFREARADVNAMLNAVEAGDIVSFVSNSGDGVDVGFVAYRQVEDGKADQLAVMSLSNMQSEPQMIERGSVVVRLEADSIQYPDLNLSLSGQAATTQVLVDYYRRVYGYNPEYFSKIEKIIRGHAFQ